MELRPTRTRPGARWALGIDRLVLPAMTILLLVGAAFLALAWAEAQDAVAVSRAKDDRRATHNAKAVGEVVRQHWGAIESWSTLHAAAFERGRESVLQRELDAIGRGGGAGALAWVVVRADGAVAGVGEVEPGRLVAGGVLDDVQAFGRLVAARNQRSTSDRLRVGDSSAYAVAVPIDPERPGGPSPGAVITVHQVDGTALGAFFPDRASAADGIALLDARERTIAGHADDRAGGRVRRFVPGTEWTLVLDREPIETILPLWTYPAYAVLLVLLAIGYRMQEANRRRLRREGDLRMRQLRTLYELASRVLHAETRELQAEQLAHNSLELAGIDGARVNLAAPRRQIEAGRCRSTDHQYRVAITGQQRPLGELVAHRADRELSPEERSVLQTAARLVGAAMHTLVALEREREAGAELQRLDELRSNLLATVAHEVRSPLTAIKGVLGLLTMQDGLPERAREYVEVATERTDRLVALTQDLFDCSLLETGQLDIRPQRQSAAALLESALGAQAAAHPGELILSATPSLMITVDPVRFDQVMNNLVSNAFRHGRPPVEVTVRTHPEGVVVVVSDEGPGIAPEDRDRIFGKFWQGSTGHARLVEGAGIGLSLVQGLVALHGGRIEIDSTHPDGRGARFTICFPDVVPGVPEREERSAGNPAAEPRPGAAAR